MVIRWEGRTHGGACDGGFGAGGAGGAGGGAGGASAWISGSSSAPITTSLL